MRPRYTVLCQWAFAILLLDFTHAQVTCENYGTPLNASACACPPGFGGPTCSAPACGGDIFQGASRPLISGSNATSFGNLTAASCTCESGWGGVGCNVCQTANVCQSAFAAAGGTTTATTDGLGTVGSNQTLTCNTSPRVYAASEMSCSVVNPTLEAVFPGSSALTILRTLNETLSPLPNTTSFGNASSIFAQLWFDGVEQFYCTANSCAQTAPAEGGSTWTCDNLACTCRTNTTFCGGQTFSIASVIDALSGQLVIDCGAVDATNGTATCAFKQDALVRLFGPSGLPLSGCTFGECVRQGVIDLGLTNDATNGTQSSGSLDGGVIGGISAVAAICGILLLLLALAWFRQRAARRAPRGQDVHGGARVRWDNLSYVVLGAPQWKHWRWSRAPDRVVLDNVSGTVEPGCMIAVLGPSGAGKTTLVELLARRHKSGTATGTIRFEPAHARVGFVPQNDVLPAQLTVFEAILFAARLRLPENVPENEKRMRTEEVIDHLGLGHVRDARIGGLDGRGISGGEMRRVSIGLELVAAPDVLILDEPTSGLDSVSALKVVNVLRAIAHDAENPTAVVASIHQPSSQIYHSFDHIILLAHGRSLYNGPGGAVPAATFAPVPENYNIADHLLDIASTDSQSPPLDSGALNDPEKVPHGGPSSYSSTSEPGIVRSSSWWSDALRGNTYAASFFTQLQVLSGREWILLKRNKTLFLAHVGIACVLGVFVGGLYFNTGVSIAGFQSRVGCLFFMGALIAFSSLSALYNVTEMRHLFVRERSACYYSPSAWLVARIVFDVVPLRIIPTLLVGCIAYWMVGLAPFAANFFRFLLVLVIYALCMAIFNFFLAALFHNGGLAILLSALTSLYQMTYAGFFVNLSSIPPVLRWLQWLCPLKYTLEALSVNEVTSGLQIADTLEGVPVDVSAALIMQKLFGFGATLSLYGRDVAIVFAFAAAFALGTLFAVLLRVRERL